MSSPILIEYFESRGVATPALLFVRKFNKGDKKVLNQEILSNLQELLANRKDPASDVEWQDVADYLSSATGQDYNRTYLRKGFFLYDLYNSAGWVRPPEDVGGSTFDEKRLAAEKAIIKLRDERNEIARIQRELARRDSLLDLVKEGIRGEITPMDDYVPHIHQLTDNDLIVHLTDIHAGIQIENYFNRYDETVLRDRMRKYTQKIDEIRQRHNSEKCYVMLGGDLVSGIIHTNLRLENNLNVVQQVKFVSNVVAGFIRNLSKMFAEVHVYSVAGNHGRVQPKKEDNLRGENFDCLVPFIVGLLLKDYENVEIHENVIEQTVAMFSVRGQKVFGVHGDKDAMDNVVQKLTMMFSMKPDIVLAGHRHTNGMRTIYDSRVIESGCISGPDSYCMDHRLKNNPEQTVIVVTDNGVECTYNVVF